MTSGASGSQTYDRWELDMGLGPDSDPIYNFGSDFEFDSIHFGA